MLYAIEDWNCSHRRGLQAFINIATLSNSKATETPERPCTKAIPQIE